MDCRDADENSGAALKFKARRSYPATLTTTMSNKPFGMLKNVEHKMRYLKENSLFDSDLQYFVDFQLECSFANH